MKNTHFFKKANGRYESLANSSKQVVNQKLERNPQSLQTETTLHQFEPSIT